MNREVSSRVQRERSAHSEGDVLGNAYRLKSLFSHTVTSRTILRMHADFNAHLHGVRDKSVLELGCGHGDFSLELLAAGASYVAGIDISDNYVADAAGKACSAGYDSSKYRFCVMDAHRLDFADDQFDFVVGQGILHHLDLSICLSEIRRVLRTGGAAIFIEPLAGNPLLKLFRMMTPSARTADEKPLDASDLREIGSGWRVASRYYGMLSAPVAVLTSVVLRPFPNNPLLALADWAERSLGSVPALRSLHQYVLLVLHKP